MVKAKHVNGPDKTIIAIDCMGGDYGPGVTVEGVAIAAKKNKTLFFMMYGVENLIKKELVKHQIPSHRYSIHHRDMSISMKEKPSNALRKAFRNNSMSGTIDAVKDKKAHAAVSAGNTGALMAFSILILKKTQGIDRPAIATLWPTVNPEKPAILLDAGADLDSGERRLLELSIYGETLSKIIADKDQPQIQPKVVLLNIGEEDIKGMQSEKNAHKILQDNKIIENYCGFAEANEIISGNHDVFVTNGYVGNMILKSVEGVAIHLSTIVKQNSRKNIFLRILYVLAIPYLMSMRKITNAERFNGGVLIGLNGIVIKSHGNASAMAFQHSILRAADFCAADLVAKLQQKFDNKKPCLDNLFNNNSNSVN